LSSTEQRPLDTIDTASSLADERIADAAVRCLLRLGIQKTSVGDVARAAGVSRGTVYRYYGDKAALVEAGLTRIATDFVQSSEASVRRRRTLAGQVGEAAVFITRHAGDPRFAIATPGEEEHLIAVLLSTQAEALLDTWVTFWEPFLASAEARGEVRPGLDRRQTGEWIVRSLITFSFLPSVSIDLADDRSIRHYVGRHVVDGLAT
jgi:AcrR family transcriptional regulator